MSQLIVITGPDGSGKSTLLANLKDSQGSRSIAYASIFDALANMKQGGLSLESVRTYMQNLSTSARWTFFLHALRHSYDLALKKKCDFIVFDSYWYKYACTELALGLPNDNLKLADILLPKAALTFYLDCDSASLQQRKANTGSTDYELGFHDAGFQPRVQQFWKKMLQERPELQILDANKAPDDLTRKFWELMEC